MKRPDLRRRSAATHAAPTPAPYLGGTDSLLSAGADAAQELCADHVEVTIGQAHILKDFTLRVSPGELVALIGPNGAGKSTALSVLSGELAPTSGCVTLGGQHVAQLPITQRARLRAVLPQSSQVAFDFLLHDVVAMGRTPWPASVDDEAIIDDALDITQVAALAGRSITTLSGGERARGSLSRVLAQTTGILLLDEPTAALDVAHQESVMDIGRCSADAGHGVIVVLHDLSLAAAWCDRMILLKDGRVVADGQPWEVCQEELLSQVYEWPLTVRPDPVTSTPLVSPLRQRPAR